MKQANIALAIFAAVAITACGGGGGSEGTVQSVSLSDNSSSNPTIVDAFESIGSHFASKEHHEFSRFDVIGNNQMLVSYSSNREDSDLVLVDYSDYNNIVYNEIGKGDHHRGVVVKDFNNDGDLEIYAFSHGYEYLINGDVETATEGKNFLIADGEVNFIDEAYTHGSCSGDFNGDTLLDLVDVNVYHGYDPLVRYGDGNNNFVDNVEEMPAAFIARDEAFTSCASNDVNGDGYDDIIFGLQGGPNHVIVYGGANGLSYDSETSIVEYGEEGQIYTLTDRGPVTTQMYTDGDYLVTFVTDYDTGTMVELFELQGTSYVHVETDRINENAGDIRVTNGTAVVTNKWRSIEDIDGYFTDYVTHVSVENGQLNIESRQRNQ